MDRELLSKSKKEFELESISLQSDLSEFHKLNQYMKDERKKIENESGQRGSDQKIMEQLKMNVELETQ